MSTSPIWLVTNPASGSNTPDAVEAIGSALCPARTIAFPNDPLPTRADLESAGVGTLAVFTGDGTINSAAAALEGWGGALLVLPGGTQNLLSKALHGDRSLDAILADLPNARRTRRRGIRTSQCMSLIEVLTGPGAMWADVREGVRDFDLGAIAETFSSALRETRDGPGVTIANSASAKAEGYRALRIAPEGSGLLAEGYDFADFADFAAQGFAMLVKRDFRQGPHDDLGHFDMIDCSSSGPIALMIDGERRQGKTAEKFERIMFPVDFITTKPGGD